MKSDIDALVPSARWHPRRVATWDPAPFGMDEDPYMAGVWLRFVIADEATMDVYELTDVDREALNRTGVLVTSPRFRDEFPFVAPDSSLRLPTGSGDVTLDVAFLDDLQRAIDDEDFVFEGVYGNGDILITEEAARAAGFEIVERGGFLRSDEPLTNSQRDAIGAAIWGGYSWLGEYYHDVPRMDSADTPPWSAVLDWPEHPTPDSAIQAILAALALVLTLLVVAIGLALAATEGAAERDVLVAVGGRPATMRSMAAVKAVVLTTTGLLLAVPFGLLPAFAVMRATGTTFEMPWLAVGLLVLVVPLLAGATAWLVSAVGQRVRPVRLSALAFD